MPEPSPFDRFDWDAGPDPIEAGLRRLNIPGWWEIAQSTERHPRRKPLTKEQTEMLRMVRALGAFPD